MDLKDFSMKELLGTAIKSEIEARNMYLSLSDQTRDAFLKDRLVFIANEESRHREFLERLYEFNFGKGSIVLPEMSAVPLPEVRIGSGRAMASELLLEAMTAERAASDFYLALSEIYEGNDETLKTLRYLSKMEMGHHSMLEVEVDRLRKEEDFEFEWSMMHIGP